MVGSMEVWGGARRPRLARGQARPLIGAPPSLPRPQDVGERRKALDFLMIAVHMAPKVICR